MKQSLNCLVALAVAVAAATAVSYDSDDYYSDDEYYYSDDDSGKKDARIAHLEKALAAEKARGARCKINLNKALSKNNAPISKNTPANMYEQCMSDGGEEHHHPAFCGFVRSCNAMGKKECECAAAGLYRIYRKYYGLTYTTWSGLGFASEHRVKWLDKLTLAGLLPENNCAMTMPSYAELKKPGESAVKITDGLEFLQSAGVSAKAWPFVLSRWTEEGGSDDGSIAVAPFDNTAKKFNLLGGKVSCPERACLLKGASPGLDPETGKPKKSLLHLTMFAEGEEFKLKKDLWEGCKKDAKSQGRRCVKDIRKSHLCRNNFFSKNKSSYGSDKAYCKRVNENPRIFINNLKFALRYFENRGYQYMKKGSPGFVQPGGRRWDKALERAKNVGNALFRNLRGIIKTGAKTNFGALCPHQTKAIKREKEQITKRAARLLRTSKKGLRKALKIQIENLNKVIRRKDDACVRVAMLKHRKGELKVPFGGKRNDPSNIVSMLRKALDREVDLFDARKRGKFDRCAALEFWCGEKKVTSHAWLIKEKQAFAKAVEKSNGSRVKLQALSQKAITLHSQQMRKEHNRRNVQLARNGQLQVSSTGKLIGLDDANEKLSRCTQGLDMNGNPSAKFAAAVATCAAPGQKQRRRLAEYSIALT